MEFKKYQHLERISTTEVQGIELGECYVFPKIDGTNASVWMSGGEIQAGSRKRHLTLESDNAGFYEWASSSEELIAYLTDNPTHRLYGEWLVPHSLKTYREDAWRKFYVFDVSIDIPDDEIEHESSDTVKYLHYDEYSVGMESYGINYILPICKISDGTYDQFHKQLEKNVFLVEDGKGTGEGVVIKNYEFKNKYGRQTWAKIVTSEFKEKLTKEMGVAELKGKKMVEREIARKYVTEALCEKVRAKIEVDEGDWSSKYIPRLLNTVYYDVVREESWNFIKDYKNPVIDFGKLQQMVFAEVKEKATQVF